MVSATCTLSLPLRYSGLPPSSGQLDEPVALYFAISRSLALIAGDGFDVAEQGAELAVVDLDAVIEIQGDLHIGVVLELVIEGAQFG